VGPIANLLVLRNFVDEKTTFRELLAQVHRVAAQALKHRAMQFDRLALALNPEKDMSRTALFDVLFEFDETGVQTFRAGSLRAHVIETNLGFGKNDLHLYVHAEGDRFAGKLAYNADLFDVWLIERMMGHYVRLLEAMAVDPAQGIDE